MTKTLPKGTVWEAAKAEKNWFVYRITPEDENGKTGKVPCRKKSGLNASTHTAACLTYSDAVTAQRDLKTRIGEVNADIDAENARRIGTARDQMEPAMDFMVGYLTRPGSAMVALDFDHVLEDGEIVGWLADVIGETYTEISASGTGLHMLTGRFPGDEGVRERNQAGLYAGDARGIALTFDSLEGTPTEIGCAPRARAVAGERIGRQQGRTPVMDRSLRLPEEMHDLDAIPDILAELPNPGADYDFWVRMAHALRAAADEADPQTALAIETAFHEWSDRMPGRATDSSQRLWKSIRNPRDISAGSFFFMARELGWSPRGAAHPPPVGLEFDHWLTRAAGGDEEALQRVIRFLICGLREDVMFVLTSSLARLSGIDPERARAIFNYEKQKADEWAVEALTGVSRAKSRMAAGIPEEIARQIMLLIDMLPTEYLDEAMEYIRSTKEKRR